MSSALLAPIDSAITAIDPFILPSVAQDAPDWQPLLSAWPGDGNEGAALLVFCRSWEDALRGKLVLPPPDVLGSVLWVNMRKSLYESIPGPEWAWAMGSGFDVPSVLPLSSALVMLETYCSCWLAGGAAERWSGEKFEAWFPWLFFALTIVSVSGVEAQVLQSIALTDPARTPAFDALDLWLQRRAACAGVRRQGIAFAEKHFQDLRLEVLASALLSDAFHLTDLGTLQNLLADRQHEVMNITVEDLLLAIERKTNKGKGFT